MENIKKHSLVGPEEAAEKGENTFIKGIRNATLVLAAAGTLGLTSCAPTVGSDPSNGNGGGNNGTTTNINFGKITATSTQEEVTNTLKLSLELLQSQTQNIINKMTEYQTSLQAQLANARPGSPTYDKILDKINIVADIINYENQIKSAQQNRNTETGMNGMNNYYGSITIRAVGLLPEQANRDIFVAKMSTYQEAVTLDERNIINDGTKTYRLGVLNSHRQDVVEMERDNGNVTYSLPEPQNNMYGLIGRLETETKQTLSDDNVLGQYGQYIFYQGQDIAQYTAVWEDVRSIGKETNLPRSVVQRLSVAEMVEEINAAPADAQADMVR
jgi:hypothetical protein